MGNQNKSLGCSVDEQTYWEFKVYAKQEGLNMSDKLKELITSYLLEKTQPVPKEVLIDVEKATEKMAKPRATEKQLAYIEWLYNRLGAEQSVRQTVSNLFEADSLIKSLRADLYGTDGIMPFNEFEQLTLEVANA